MRKLIAAAGLAVVLAGCGGSGPPPEAYLASGLDPVARAEADAATEVLSEDPTLSTEEIVAAVLEALATATTEAPTTTVTTLPPPPDLLGMTLIEAQRAAGVVGYSICYEVGEYETDGMAAVGLVVHQYLDLADPECGITVDLEQSEGAVLIDEVNLPAGLYRITPDGMIQEVQE